MSNPRRRAAAIDTFASVNKQQPDTEAREEFLDRAAAFGADVTVQVGDMRFLIDPADKTVGGMLFRSGTRGEFRQLGRMVSVLAELPLARPDSVPGRKTFLDVGANIGTSTIAALMLHGFDRAVACEPAPRNLQLLRANLALNDLTSEVRVLPAAVADVPGTAELLISRTNSGGHRVRGVAEKDHDGHEKVHVEQITLDWIVQRGILNPEEIAVVWVDAQGYEGHILAGGGAITESGAPLVSEYHPQMLNSVDGRLLFEGTVNEHYTHFLDLRHARRGYQLSELLRPVSQISGLAAELTSGERAFTDLLIVRLKGSL